MTQADRAASVPAPPTVQGRVLAGRYELGATLGSGGMARVLLARDRVLDREVAVKVLREQFAADPVFLARFTREARYASRLSHPGLVTIFDTGVDHGTAFIVMERVQGRTLREILTSEGTVPVDEAVEICAAVCEVLDVTHRAGVVHRDIKPGNIAISVDGRVRVFDFGIARVDGSEPLTQTATVIGTAAYLSPEQASGRSAGPPSDLYALGCVLVELLTGSPPFTAQTAVGVVYQHVSSEPGPPSARRPEVPAALDAVVLRLLAKDPADRPATAGQARLELLRCLAPNRGDTQLLTASDLGDDLDAEPFVSKPRRLGRSRAGRAVLGLRPRSRWWLACSAGRTSDRGDKPQAPRSPPRSPRRLPPRSLPGQHPRPHRGPQASRRLRR